MNEPTSSSAAVPVGHLGVQALDPNDVERLQDEIGVEHDAKPGPENLSIDVFRDYATYCIAHANPLWTDPDYARRNGFESVLAPPTVEYVTSSRDLSIGGFGLHDRGIMGLHMFDDWEFHEAPRVNEPVTASYHLAHVRMRDSRWAGGSAMEQVICYTYRGENGRLLSTWSRGSFRAKRPMLSDGEATLEEPYRYTREEIDQIYRDMDAERPRGAQRRWIEEISVGDSIGQVVKGPLTQMDMICWWIGAKGPFLYPFGMKYEMVKANPGLAILDPDTGIPLTPEDAHWDLSYALRNGVRGLYDAGKQRTAAVTHLATNWMGDHGKLKRLKLQMRAPNMVGNTTWYSGAVTEIDAASCTVTCEVEGRNQRDVVHCRGNVVIELPSRRTGEA